MTPARQILIGLHVVLGLLMVALLCRSLGDRAQAVNQVRIIARAEHAKTLDVQADIARMDELRKGLERQDPYVVELLARARLQYGKPGEITPPPAPGEAAHPLAVDLH